MCPYSYIHTYTFIFLSLSLIREKQWLSFPGYRSQTTYGEAKLATSLQQTWCVPYVHIHVPHVRMKRLCVAAPKVVVAGVVHFSSL